MATRGGHDNRWMNDVTSASSSSPLKQDENSSQLSRLLEAMTPLPSHSQYSTQERDEGRTFNNINLTNHYASEICKD